MRFTTCCSCVSTCETDYIVSIHIIRTSVRVDSSLSFVSASLAKEVRVRMPRMVAVSFPTCSVMMASRQLREERGEGEGLTMHPYCSYHTHKPHPVTTPDSQNCTSQNLLAFQDGYFQKS